MSRASPSTGLNSSTRMAAAWRTPADADLIADVKTPLRRLTPDTRVLMLLGRGWANGFAINCRTGGTSKRFIRTASPSLHVQMQQRLPLPRESRGESGEVSGSRISALRTSIPSYQLCAAKRRAAPESGPIEPRGRSGAIGEGRKCAAPT
jgi:hypothetical protein